MANCEKRINQKARNKKKIVKVKTPKSRERENVSNELNCINVLIRWKILIKHNSNNNETKSLIYFVAWNIKISLDEWVTWTREKKFRIFNIYQLLSSSSVEKRLCAEAVREIVEKTIIISGILSLDRVNGPRCVGRNEIIYETFDRCCRQENIMIIDNPQ